MARTIKDISRELGISHATVSYVLNGRGEALKIRPALQEKIRRTADELGYVRNSIAHSMVTGRRDTFGLVNFSTKYLLEYPSKIFSGCITYAEKSKYSIKQIASFYPRPFSLFSKRTREKKVDLIIRSIREQQLAGVLTLPTYKGHVEPLLERLKDFGIPCCTLDSPIESDSGFGIFSDDAPGIKKVVDHLYSLGHRRMAFAGRSDVEVFDYSFQRRCGFIEAVKKYKDVSYSIIPELVCDVRFSNQGAFAGILAQSDNMRPSAIVCESDYFAIDAIRFAMQLGMNVPKDLSVTGFASLDISYFTPIRLTTVEQPFFRMGYEAMKRMIETVEGKKNYDGCNFKLKTKLIVSESTAAPFDSKP